MILEHIKELFRGNQLLGEDYDKSLEYINSIIPIKIIEIPSGTKLGTWTVPNEWIVKEAWVKLNGKKVIDWEDEPLSLMSYSQPFKGVVAKEELSKHLFYNHENPDNIPYTYSFYEPKWGFGVKKEFAFKKLPGLCQEGQKCPDKYSEIETLPDGEYEVFINTEFKPGIMKIGVHTIQGLLPPGSKKEILLFAHLDHPWQANDNLSGVACLMDLANKLKCEHTIKIIFCPETIGSIAYAETQDISKVDFVIAVDAIGNDNTLLIQKTYDKYARINYAVHLAVQELGVSYRKGEFRLLIGSDETVFNDPLIGIPGIMFSRYPFKEYHTSADMPETMKTDKIEEIQDVILKTIEIYEKDYIPIRKEKGVLFRSGFGVQSPDSLTNRALDYAWYDCDGKKYVSEITLPLGLSFTMVYDFFKKLEKNGIISGINTSQRKIKKIGRKK